MCRLISTVSVVSIAVLAMLVQISPDPVLEIPTQKDLTGKAVLITGGNSGVGHATAKALSGMGAEVVITSRSEKRANDAAKSFGGIGLSLDLSNLAGVRQFAQGLLERFAEKPLDILILNAGMVYGDGYAGPFLTADGLDTLMASNYFGHFLLVHLLRPLLERSKTRIVVMSSMAHRFAGRELVMPNFPLIDNTTELSVITSLSAYGASKLQNLLFAFKMQRDLTSAGITTTACTCGAVKTSIGAIDRDNGRGATMDLPVMEPEEGAKPLLAAALTDEVPVEKLITPYWTWEALEWVLPARVLGYVYTFIFEAMLQKLTWGKMRAHKPSLEARDLQLQESLWQWTLERIGAEM